VKRRRRVEGGGVVAREVTADGIKYLAGGPPPSTAVFKMFEPVF
jgi:hypothetical protein